MFSFFPPSLHCVLRQVAQFAPHTQAFQNLDPSSISTGPFNTALGNPPAMKMTEAISPRTLPQQAPPSLSPNALSAPALPKQPKTIASNSAQSSANGPNYNQPSYEAMSAEALDSFGTSEDVLVINLQDYMSHQDIDDFMDGLMIRPNGSFPDPDELAQWGLTMELHDTDNIICEVGDLSQFALM